jgi:hypothetical protein
MTATEPNQCVCGGVLGSPRPEVVAKQLATKKRLETLCKRHRVDIADRTAVYRLLKSVRNPGRYCLLLDFTDTL